MSENGGAEKGLPSELCPGGGLCLLAPSRPQRPVLETVRVALSPGISGIRDGPSAAGLVFEMEEPADKTGHRATPGTRWLATVPRVF